MPTLMDSIEERYMLEEDFRDYGFIVFVSESPDCKMGKLPRIMMLCSYDIDAVGKNGIEAKRLSHIRELDLTDNLVSEWSEVLTILSIFKSLTFLNLSNNLLSDRLHLATDQFSSLSHASLRKLALNGNRLDWSSVHHLASLLPNLEELHLSNNALPNPKDEFSHPNLKSLFLTCNEITSFNDVYEHLGSHCPSLESLSLAECPITDVPCLTEKQGGFRKLIALNLTTTRIKNWSDVDNLRAFPALNELRFKDAPLLDDYTMHEKRLFLIARLPNVLVLNGGGAITQNEREDAERAFIRFYMDLPPSEQPARYHELVEVHGHLDPLVNINLKPETHAKVEISYKDQDREETVSLYQTVQQFKTLLHQWFEVPTQNMRLYYYDQIMAKVTGPEEMKWPNKELYTYNVRDGDRFVVDEKVAIGKLRTRNLSFTASQISPIKPRTAITFGMSPMRNGGGGWSPFRNSPKFGEATTGPSWPQHHGHGSARPSAAAAEGATPNGAAKVSRNLFGKESAESSTSNNHNNNNNSSDEEKGKN